MLITQLAIFKLDLIRVHREKNYLIRGIESCIAAPNKEIYSILTNTFILSRQVLLGKNTLFLNIHTL